MLQQGHYLILGIGTDIGKTFFLEKLCQKFPNSLAIKPVISGFKEGDANSDSAKILRALNLELNQKNLDEISPWRFEKAVSPHFAGRVDYQELLDFCRKKISQAKAENKFLFIESAGGVMTPINEEKTFLDLAIDLKIPTLLILGNYLGAISHSLTAIAMLKKSEVLIEKIILNEILPAENSAEEIAATITNFSGSEVIAFNDFLK